MVLNKWTKAGLGGVAIGALALAALAQSGVRPSSDLSAIRVVPGRSTLQSPRLAKIDAAVTQTVAPASLNATYNFAPITTAINESPINSMYVIIGNNSGELYRYSKNGFDPAQPTRLASASKWLVGIVGMRMVEAGLGSLDGRMRDDLDFWTQNTNNSKSGVKLWHTLSMTSGFNTGPVSIGCHSLQMGTLKQCAKTIHDLWYGVDAQNAPGAQFSYGPHGVQIAAAYLEQTEKRSGRLNRSYRQLFNDYLVVPAGLTNTTVSEVGSANQNTQNPWIAGGAWSTANDYAKIMKKLLDGSLITNMTDFTRSRTTGLRRVYVPGSAGAWQYALGSFLECDELPDDANPPCATSKINSSPGAYGWVGWIDRENGYYAVIATDDGTGGDQRGVDLEQILQPRIVTALANPS